MGGGFWGLRATRGGCGPEFEESTWWSGVLGWRESDVDGVGDEGAGLLRMVACGY